MPTSLEYDPHAVGEEARKMMGLYTEEEAAALLLLNSTTTLATWRSQNRGPRHVKLGKRVFYVASDISEWVVSERARQAQEASAA